MTVGVFVGVGLLAPSSPDEALLYIHFRLEPPPMSNWDLQKDGEDLKAKAISAALIRRSNAAAFWREKCCNLAEDCDQVSNTLTLSDDAKTMMLLDQRTASPD